jgi:hypothetical protein
MALSARKLHTNAKNGDKKAIPGTNVSDPIIPFAEITVSVESENTMAKRMKVNRTMDI